MNSKRFSKAIKDDIRKLDVASQEALEGQLECKNCGEINSLGWGTKKHRQALENVMGRTLSDDDYIAIKHMVHFY
jgi:hypothetical protein